METFRANAFAGHTRMGVCISRQGAGIGILPEYRCRYCHDICRIPPMVTQRKAVYGVAERTMAGLTC